MRWAGFFTSRSVAGWSRSTASVKPFGSTSIAEASPASIRVLPSASVTVSMSRNAWSPPPALASSRDSTEPS